MPSPSQSRAKLRVVDVPMTQATPINRMQQLQADLRTTARMTAAEELEKLQQSALTLKDLATLDIYDAGTREAMNRLSATLTTEADSLTKLIKRSLSEKEPLKERA